MSYSRELSHPKIIEPLIDPLDCNYLAEEAASIADAPTIWKKNELISSSIETPLSENTEERQSIFESYDPLHDAERLQKLSHLSPELQRYYIKENLLSYFEEFAAEIRVKKLAGVIRDTGEMEILGTNVTEMYNHSAQLAGAGSREDKERKGLDLISKGMLQGCNRIAWTSPPKGADYGFVFVFITDEYDGNSGWRPFRELLLRYDEPLGSIERSKNIYQSINNDRGQATTDVENFVTPDDFLEQPIMYHTTDFSDLHNIYQMLNISDQDIEKSEVFRQRLEPYITPMMDEYTTLLRYLSSHDLSTKDQQIRNLEDQCKVLIGGMFNAARIIARSFNEHPLDQERFSEDEELLKELSFSYDNPNLLFEQAARLAYYEDLTIVGGSNCPVTRSTGNSELEFLTRLSTGMGWVGASQMSALAELVPAEKKYKFDKPGTCQSCNKNHEKVGLLGPCLVCKSCQQHFDIQDYQEKLRQRLG